MKIILLRTWLNNIGNGFIDKGAKEVIRRSFNDAEIIEVSGYSNHVAHDIHLGPSKTLTNAVSSLSRIGGIGHVIRGGIRFYEQLKQVVAETIGLNDRLDTCSRYNDSKSQDNMFNLVDLIDADLAVLPGCILGEHVFERYFETLLQLKSRNIPIIFLGAGGFEYNKTERHYVRDVLKKLNPDAIITRDSSTYDTYEDHFEFAYDGIDCAMFIDGCYDLPEANDTFITSVFDKMKEPSLNKDTKIIRPTHYLFSPNKMRLRYLFEKKNCFISDQISDYLFLYKNTEVVHSDRIHACVPTLIFGNKAQFYYDTPRARLFQKVLSQDIREQPVSINQSRLMTERKEMINAFQKAVELILEEN